MITSLPPLQTSQRTPSAWMMMMFSLSLQILFQMLVPPVGHFNRALLGHSWKAPRHGLPCRSHIVSALGNLSIFNSGADDWISVSDHLLTGQVP